MIDDVLSHGIWRHLCKNYSLSRLSRICNVSNYWVYCNGVIYHTEVYEEKFDVESKIAQTTLKKVYWRKVETTTEWQTSVNIREISYSNLETGRYGPKSGVSRIIRESWRELTALPFCVSFADPLCFFLWKWGQFSNSRRLLPVLQCMPKKKIKRAFRQAKS